MPKLIIKIDHEFVAGPFLHNNDDSQTVPLKPAQTKKMLANAKELEFSIAVTFLDPETNSPSINFDLTKKGLKKGGVFTWSIDEANSLVKVCISGEISSGNLRAGVAPRLEEAYSTSKLRLDAFNFKSGEWSGFRAPLLNQDEENCKDWYIVPEWKVK